MYVSGMLNSDWRNGIDNLNDFFHFMWCHDFMVLKYEGKFTLIYSYFNSGKRSQLHDV